MGFRVGEVQTAIARVLSMRENQEDLPVELMLREALLAATPDIRRRRV
jgi:hypothetical protein